MSLSLEEQIRYSRHLNLPQFGKATQEKLKSSRVLVVGTGGLGAPLLQYLTAAGVGTIGLVDFDTVDTSNLQRQILFGTSDVGANKTDAAARKLRDMNPHVNIITFNERFTSENAMRIVRDFDVVADGTDNFPTRYLVNDTCVLSNKVNVYASIFQFEGQVSVFNLSDEKGYRGPNYRDLFPTPPPPGMVPSCAEGGVLGVLPGIIGSIQALEVIKVLTGIGKPLSGKLFLLDTLDFTTRVVNVRKDENNPLTGKNPTIKELIDYEEFCGLNTEDLEVQEVTAEELHEYRQQGKKFTLIDVREPYEYEAGNLGGDLIPVGNIAAHTRDIPKEGMVILHCKSGARSSRAIKLLSERFGYQNLKNLKGGIIAYRDKYDTSLSVL